MSSRTPFSDDALTVDLGGERVAIPHRNAVEWINAIHGPQSVAGLVVILARETSRELILDALSTGDLENEQLSKASYDLLKMAAPFYSWWVTAKLLILSGKPEVLGRTVLAGMDPWSLTVAQWVTAIYALLTEHADEKGRFKFDAMLQTPPAGIEDDDWGDESFDAMVAQARRMPGMG